MHSDGDCRACPGLGPAVASLLTLDRAAASFVVIPAQAETQGPRHVISMGWVPACAGMTSTPDTGHYDPSFICPALLRAAFRNQATAVSFRLLTSQHPRDETASPATVSA